MTTRPRTLVPLVIVAFLLVGVTGCSSGGPASVTNATDDPSAEDTDGTEPTADPPCEATATVEGETYHVVQAMSDDYGVKPDYQFQGTATDCSGTGAEPMLFHPIPKVDPDWALCGLVDGRWRVFLADDIAVPVNSTLARIVSGQ